MTPLSIAAAAECARQYCFVPANDRPAYFAAIIEKHFGPEIARLEKEKAVIASTHPTTPTT